MPLKISKTRTFTRTCTAADGSTFEATFKALSDDEVDGHDFTSLAGEKAFLRDVVKGLGDIIDDEDKPLPFEAALDFVLGAADLRKPLLVEYRLGVIGARTGN
ncbi:hypothetical protein [Tropicibacter sp. S64]|uniref:hypothetical protein n=1 Tax=Tropicibacter sp. S64 TaxID=3415122 RepID=UPI003C7C15BB